MERVDVIILCCNVIVNPSLEVKPARLAALRRILVVCDMASRTVPWRNMLYSRAIPTDSWPL
jgi:hypothetical protein